MICHLQHVSLGIKGTTYYRARVISITSDNA